MEPKKISEVGKAIENAINNSNEKKLVQSFIITRIVNEDGSIAYNFQTTSNIGLNFSVDECIGLCERARDGLIGQQSTLINLPKAEKEIKEGNYIG